MHPIFCKTIYKTLREIGKHPKIHVVSGLYNILVKDMHLHLYVNIPVENNKSMMGVVILYTAHLFRGAQ